MTTLAPTSQADDSNPFGDEILSYYGRAEAVDDGLLVDVTGEARKRGLKLPTFLTRAAHAETVRWGKDDEAIESGQSEKARLEDVLNMASFYTRVAVARDPSVDVVPFRVRRVPSLSSESRRLDVDLRMTIGVDKTGPAFIISLRGED